VVAVGPAQQVVRFYDAVGAHDFSRAASLWSASMRQRYPPSTYINGRFSNTTGFDIRRAQLTSRSGDRATVAVDIVEHRSTSPTTERWVGSWSLVRSGGTWLLDDPNLAAA
jgi:limonene-1,2-epoxide hydrolase